MAINCGLMEAGFYFFRMITMRNNIFVICNNIVKINFRNSAQPENQKQEKGKKSLYGFLLIQFD